MKRLGKELVTITNKITKLDGTIEYSAYTKKYTIYERQGKQVINFMGFREITRDDNGSPHIVHEIKEFKSLSLIDVLKETLEKKQNETIGSN